MKNDGCCPFVGELRHASTVKMLFTKPKLYYLRSVSKQNLDSKHIEIMRKLSVTVKI